MPSWSPDGNTLHYFHSSGEGESYSEEYMASHLSWDPGPTVESTDALFGQGRSYREFASGLHPTAID